jgi:hypothetical protein
MQNVDDHPTAKKTNISNQLDSNYNSGLWEIQ